jgi:hypothetical protein
MISVNGCNVLYRNGKIALTQKPFKDVKDGEMFVQVWDCPTCSEKGIWGEWLSCPTCKMPQPPNKMYTPNQCWVIVDKDLKDSYKQGPFWLCSRKLNTTPCLTVNTHSDIACSTCSGDRQMYSQYFTATLEDSITRGKSIIKEQEEEIANAINEGVQTSVFGDDNVPFDPNLLKQQTQNTLKIGIANLQSYFKWIAGLVISVIISFGFWYQFVASVQATGRVIGYEWSRTIDIQRLVLVAHEDSIAPLGAINVVPFQKAVSEHQVPTGKLIQNGFVQKEDLTKTISFDCSQTTGSGAAVKKTCTKHPLISVPNYVPETETVYDYETWYRYKMKEWEFARYVKASGKDLKPNWPAYTLAQNPPERESTQSQTYTVFLKNNQTGNLQSIHPSDETTWKSYQKSQLYAYNTNRAGMIISRVNPILRGQM